jgi:PAS domain S-box-containing protein
MNPHTKILLVEHDPNDIDLIQHELRKVYVNFEAAIVETADDYEQTLRTFEPEIILSDFILPSFAGAEAFKIKEKIAPLTPFIFVSGTIGEENSIEFIKKGVTDYVLKDHLFTLNTKVTRALKEAAEKKQKLETQLALVKSERKYRHLFRGNPQPLWVMDLKSFRFLDVNDAALEHYGYTREEFLSMSAVDLRPPDERERFLGYVRNMDPSLHNTGIWTHLKKDGTIIYAEISATEIVYEGTAARLVLANDVTDRKKAEEKIKELNEHLEERVQQRTAELSEANKSLAAFSSTVSHDLRAPLRSIVNFTSIIQQDYGERMEPEEKEIFDYIKEGALRMNTIIEDLLKLAKYGHEKLKLEQVNMARLINSIWLNLSRTTPHRAVLKLTEMPDVLADMSLMEQAVVNLLSNAIKYSSKKENPTVWVWSERGNDSITIYFKDNGAGFDMNNYPRLFGAFQRLHGQKEFEGTGVGLTLVKRIIEKHNGTVGANAKVNEGATFYITLPIVEPNALD